MKTLTLANQEYAYPEKGGFGLGLRFFEQVLAIYRRDNPGPSKLVRDEFLSFLQKMPGILLTTEAALDMLYVALRPVKSAIAISTAIDYAEKAELYAACDAVRPLFGDLMDKNLAEYIDAISSEPAGTAKMVLQVIMDSVSDETNPADNEAADPTANENPQPADAPQSDAPQPEVEQPSEPAAEPVAAEPAEA